jgi:hypothetical protein
MLALVSAGCMEDSGNAAEPVESTDSTEPNGNNTEDDDEEMTVGDGSQEAVEEYGEILSRIPPSPNASGSDIMAEFETAGLTASGFFGIRQRVSPSVARLVEDGDEESPPRLRTAHVNMSDETKEYELVSLPPYEGVAENENGDVMYAVPTEEHDLAESTPEVARDEGAWYLEGEQNRGEWLPTTFELAPETGYVGDYFLVSENGELGEGDYRFGEGQERGPEMLSMTVSAWETGSPGPSEGSRFESGSLPEDTNGQQLSFYHDADKKTEAYLKPSKELVELSPQEEAEMEFELTNRSEVISSTADWSWSLRKLVDGDWSLVDAGQGGRVGDYRIVWSGRKMKRRVRYSHGKPEEDNLISVGGGEFAYMDTEGNGDGSDHDGHAVHTYDATRVFGPMGGGTYAYDPNASFGGVRPAAVFEVEAPPIEVEPPEDASAERDGARVVVTVGDETGSAFVVERADMDDAEVVPSEALYGVENSLRYAVPFFDDGVDGVRVEADEGTVEDALLSEDERVFEHGGTVYRATKE